MAGTYSSTSPTGYPVQIADNIFMDTGTFTDDATTADVVAKFPMRSLVYAVAYQTDAANKVLEVDTGTANQVTFESPTSGKTYTCLVIGFM